MKQTAIDWLVEEIKADDWWYLPQSMKQDIIEQAKEMEEKNLKDSFVAGAEMGEMFNNENRCYVSDAEQYLKQTFKSE